MANLTQNMIKFGLKSRIKAVEARNVDLFWQNFSPHNLHFKQNRVSLINDSLLHHSFNSVTLIANETKEQAN